MRRFRHETGEGLVAGIEFGDPVKPIDALFLHATGFNAMTYQSILAPLGFRTRVAAIDLRGHGRTTLKEGRLPSWTRFRNDVIAWIDKHAPDGLVLGGHSMGGTVALMVAGKRPDLVKGLVLADPVILPPGFYRAVHLAPFSHIVRRYASPMSRVARRRRPEFPSLEEARSSYKGRGAFSTWREPFLDDYLHDGLDRIDPTRPAHEVQPWRLLCSPKWEAKTFAAQRNRPWSALSKVLRKRIPITVLRADRDSVMTDKVAERLVRKCPIVVMKTVRGSTHFLPMEAPYAVRDAFSDYLARFVEGFSPADEGPVKRSLIEGGQW